MWSRCVNTRGIDGANIPCDLFMEHRRLKTVIMSMGANVSPKSIQKAGKAIAPVQHVCEIFEQQTAPYMHSDLHATPQFGKDFRTVLSVLTSEQVFSEVKGIIYLTAISPLYLRNIQSRILRKTSRRVSNNYIIHNYTSKMSKCYRLHMIQSITQCFTYITTRTTTYFKPTF